MNTKRKFKYKLQECTIPVKRLMLDKYDQIPEWQLEEINNCLDCHLPVMRCLYQQEETYLLMCMSCGAVHRIFANSPKKAKEKYNAISENQYKLMKHTIGEDDYPKQKVYRNYYIGESKLLDNVSDEYVQKYWCENVETEQTFRTYTLTDEGIAFMGYVYDRGKYKKIIW